jgi:hypothetical protein
LGNKAVNDIFIRMSCLLGFCPQFAITKISNNFCFRKNTFELCRAPEFYASDGKLKEDLARAIYGIKLELTNIGDLASSRETLVLTLPRTYQVHKIYRLSKTIFGKNSTSSTSPDLTLNSTTAIQYEGILLS